VKYYEYQIFKEAMVVADDRSVSPEVREERLLALKSKSKEVKQVTPVVSDKPEH
jgi:hypothetical protein